MKPRHANFLRSVFFTAGFFIWNFLVSVFGLWSLPLGRPMVMRVVRVYVDGIYWLERNILGLDFDIRGAEFRPTTPCIIALKHQSTYETMKLHRLFGDPMIILKQELTKIPLWGWYAKAAQMIAIDRKAGSNALQQIITQATPLLAEGRTLVIFPQGTRVPIGAWRDYRYGVIKLQDALQLPIVPVALNSGAYWPRLSFWKGGGRVVFQFLPPILPDAPAELRYAQLVRSIETTSNQLAAEIGFPQSVLPENFDQRHGK